MNTDVHVYIICNGPNDGHSGPVKIGMADNPRTRLSGLQSGNPNKLVIWRTYPTPHRDIARALERGFHSVMKKKRVSGEWFDVTPRQAEGLMRLNIVAAMQANRMPEDLIRESIGLMDETAIYHDS